MEACLAGKSVLFTNIPNLVIELKESMSANQLNFYKRRFGKYDLVILDELGYVSFDQIGSEILFNLLSNRTNAGSMIITTNMCPAVNILDARHFSISCVGITM
ncbi:ATP-binding protein [Enterococcus sp. AZ196]|uniref:ATP-binding protein n=1 Tax=Enterococcus sp. AZ196 TaxID=2774659 RepID=UPI003D2AB3B3